MSKKSSDKKKYTSNSERQNVSKKILKAVARDTTYLDTTLARLDAYAKGKKTNLDTYSMPPLKRFKENRFSMTKE